ncbi:MAG: hypothetical protein O3C43_02900 [Verrucomicrobia bacterium]|nr:hypothetical protein [Verrucomicrobiota bacterium]MDA1065433.1 hypothetical protein [Verrucomicrobiota bacterium]
MDILEAKQILSAYQSGKDHFSDPHMLEALGLLDKEPELAAWFENQLAFDRQVQEALADAPDIDGLKDAILADYRKARHNKVVSYIRWASAIAAVLLIGVGGFLGYAANYNSKMHDYATLREGMSHFIAKSYFMLDYMDKDLANIEDWLQDKDAPLYESVPALLAQKEPIGCKKMEWQGHEVSLVCFHREDGKIIHMFVAERSGFTEEAIANLDKVLLSHDLETGGWVTDTHVYLLTGSEPGVTVREYLG